MRFCGLALHDAVPDAKTIWLYREQLMRAGALQRLFERFDAILRERGYLAMGGQIVDATVIEARRPRLSRGEKETIKSGGTPADWSKAKRAQVDRDGRWTIKRGRKQPTPDDRGVKRQATAEIAIPRTTSASTGSSVRFFVFDWPVSLVSRVSALIRETGRRIRWQTGSLPPSIQGLFASGRRRSEWPGKAA